jgi:hypothetical protein
LHASAHHSALVSQPHLKDDSPTATEGGAEAGASGSAAAAGGGGAMADGDEGGGGGGGGGGEGAFLSSLGGSGGGEKGARKSGRAPTGAHVRGALLAPFLEADDGLAADVLARMRLAFYAAAALTSCGRGANASTASRRSRSSVPPAG